MFRPEYLGYFHPSSERLPFTVSADCNWSTCQEYKAVDAYPSVRPLCQLLPPPTKVRGTLERRKKRERRVGGWERMVWNSDFWPYDGTVALMNSKQLRLPARDLFKMKAGKFLHRGQMCSPGPALEWGALGPLMATGGERIGPLWGQDHW